MVSPSTSLSLDPPRATKNLGRRLVPRPFHCSPPPRIKGEREYRAFRQLLPNLLLTERGKYVAIREERVIGDRDEMALIARQLLP